MWLKIAYGIRRCMVKFFIICAMETQFAMDDVPIIPSSTSAFSKWGYRPRSDSRIVYGRRRLEAYCVAGCMQMMPGHNMRCFRCKIGVPRNENYQVHGKMWYVHNDIHNLGLNRSGLCLEGLPGTFVVSCRNECCKSNL